MPTGRPHPCARLAVPLGLALASATVTPATAAAANGFKRDRTPLPADVTGAGTTTHAAVQSSGSGGAALRMLLGLAVVLALIFVIYKLLKRSAKRNDGTVAAHGRMTVVSSTPLGPSRSLHLVRVGPELVLVGASEQGVTPIRVYSAEEVRRLGIDVETVEPFVETGGAPASVGSALVTTLRKMTVR